jgi:hypothetical protein
MKYALISETEPGEVAKQVNTHLRDGWELYGHLSVIPFDVPGEKVMREHYCVYTQAMIKNDETINAFDHDVA